MVNQSIRCSHLIQREKNQMIIDTVIDFTKLIPKEDRDTEFEDDELDEFNILIKDKPNLRGTKRKYIHIDGKDENGSDYRGIDEDKDEEDEYIISNIPFKRTQKVQPSKNINNEDQNENFDDLDYLDVLNNPSIRICEIKNVTLDVNLIPFNLENIVDQRSATVIWPLLKSRKIILLGPPEAQNETIISNLNKKILMS